MGRVTAQRDACGGLLTIGKMRERGKKDIW